jgi:hypothetical protein
MRCWPRCSTPARYASSGAFATPGLTDGWRRTGGGHRSYAEAVVRAQLKLGSTVERQLVRRCDLLTPPESVVSYPENQEDGD